MLRRLGGLGFMSSRIAARIAAIASSWEANFFSSRASFCSGRDGCTLAGAQSVVVPSRSKLRPLVEANLRQLRAYRALQAYYDRWGELRELERAHVFRVEAEQEHWPIA